MEFLREGSTACIRNPAVGRSRAGRQTRRSPSRRPSPSSSGSHFRRQRSEPRHLGCYDAHGSAPGTFWVALVAALLWSAPFPTHAQVLREYQIKAVFLFNFAQFAEWPAEAFTNSQAPLTIGILGIDPFGRALEDTVRDERVRGRRIELRHYRAVEEIKTCHILYIS